MTPRPTSREGALVAAIRQYLEWRGAVVVRVNSGATVLEHNGRKRVIRMAAAGTSDILACYRGRFVALEIKREGNKATEAQNEFIERVRKAGGIGEVVFGVDDVEKVLERVEGR